MTYLKQLAAKLTPAIVMSVAAAVLASLAAFGITLSAPQQASVVVFAGAASLVVLKYPTVESIVGLVAAALSVAVVIGLPVTKAQSESVVGLTILIAGLVLGKAGVKVAVARIRASGPPVQPTASKPDVRKAASK